jgi:hypothetical protein
MMITMHVQWWHFIDVNLINIVPSFKLHRPEVRHVLFVAYIREMRCERKRERKSDKMQKERERKKDRMRRNVHTLKVWSNEDKDVYLSIARMMSHLMGRICIL